MAEQRSVRGAHVPNQKFYHIEQMLRVASQTGAVTILHVQMFNDPLFGGRNADNENENWYYKLRFGHEPQGIPAAPERFIHVRMYHPNWTSLNPQEWGRHTVELLSNWQGARTTEGKRANLWEDAFVGVSVVNEANLHYECGDPNPGNQPNYQTPAHYARIAEWEDAVWSEIDRLVPGRKALRVQGALAFGHEPPGTEPGSEYAVPRYRQMLDKVDVLAAHPYCFLARPWGSPSETVIEDIEAALQEYCSDADNEVLNPDLALSPSRYRFYTLHRPRRAGLGPLGGDAGAPWGSDAYWYILNDFRPKGFKNANDPGGLLAQVPNKPILFTEAGTFSHSMTGFTDKTERAMKEFLGRCADSGRCIGVTWFIWNSGDEHRDNLIWPNEDLRGRMERMPAYLTRATVPARGNNNGGNTDVDLITRLNQLLPGRFQDLRAVLPDITGKFGRYGQRNMQQIDTLTIHHTVVVADALAIYRGHLAQDWSGIGYHFLITPNGDAQYVGDLATSRASVENQNDHIVGIALVGNFTSQAPTDAQIQAAAMVCRAIRDYLGRELPIDPHRKWTATACPGDTYTQWLPRLVNQAAKKPVPQPTVDYGKVVYFLEEAQRMAEREGLLAESRYIGQNFTSKAIALRDTPTQ